MKTSFTILLSILCILRCGAQQTVGMFNRTPASEDGYVLFAPMSSRTTYLMDKCGKEVHQWTSNYRPGNSVYLLPDGMLLRTGNAGNPLFPNGGIIEKLDWNSHVTWSYQLSNNQEAQHHDVCIMPNGHILVLAWELKTRAECIAEGRDSNKLGTSLWSEKILELEPVGANSVKVVWEWRLWDHMVQDLYPGMPNFGSIADHPELVNINYPSINPFNPDWLHTNSIAYNEELDQIMISVFYLNELWIIDHSTTTNEAQSHRGGRYGKGGDLLYRWGNPKAYGRGTETDQVLFNQHNAHWIEDDRPDSGKIMVFNNGQGRPGVPYSSVMILTPPLDANGGYHMIGNSAYEPQHVDWEYKAPNPADFYSPILAGAGQLPNGNALICEATKGTFFEVDKSGNVVWKYVSPVNGNATVVSQGDTARQNLVFRCPQYPTSYSGFAGRNLVAGAPIEQNPLSYHCVQGETLRIEANNPTGAGFGAVNPFGNSITLRSDATAGPIRVKLINSMGVVCGSWELDAVKGKPLNLEPPGPLSPGMYLLRIESEGKQTILKLQHGLF